MYVCTYSLPIIFIIKSFRLSLLRSRQTVEFFTSFLLPIQLFEKDAAAGGEAHTTQDNDWYCRSTSLTGSAPCCHQVSRPVLPTS